MLKMNFSVHFQCYVGSLFLGCFLTPTTNSLILLTPTGCPTIQFDSDINYPELLSDPTGLRGSHKTAFTSNASYKYWAPGYPHSVQLGYKVGEFPQLPSLLSLVIC